MESKDLKWMRGQSAEALTKAVADIESRLQALRFQLSSNQLKAVRDVRALRQELARLQTVLREKRNVTA